jgi:hypothetical protein
MKEKRGMDMRYSRFRKNQSKKRYATFILLMLLGFGLIYVASAGTLGKFVSNLILPVLNGEESGRGQVQDSDDPILSLPDETDEPVKDTTKITDTLKANALSLYAIQMGAFADEENAEAFSQQLKKRGGAGYIYNNGFYRVMAIGFQSEDDAKQVRDELRAEDIESHVYKLATGGADMQITATQENVDIIRSAYGIWEEKYRSLEEIIVSLDSGAISPSEAVDKIRETKTEMELKKEKLQEINAGQNNNAILAGLVELYNGSCLSLDKVLSKNSNDKVAISSEIKYTYIDMLMLYKDYMEQIT